MLRGRPNDDSPTTAKRLTVAGIETGGTIAGVMFSMPSCWMGHAPMLFEFARSRAIASPSCSDEERRFYTMEGLAGSERVFSVASRKGEGPKKGERKKKKSGGDRFAKARPRHVAFGPPNCGFQGPLGQEQPLGAG